MGKHAILILAHNKYEQLATLLSCLDSKNTDLFIHIDKKVSFSDTDKEMLQKAVSLSGVYYSDRTEVSWGAYSMVNAELVLLKKAMQNDRYDYYHLLSGVDMPLRPIDDILKQYQKNSQVEYIALEEPEDVEKTWWVDRIKFFYPFQERFSRFSVLDRILRKGGILIQRIMCVNRIKPDLKYGIGSMWFSITDRFARYLISQEPFIQKHFSRGYCVDEIFLQTVYLNWKDKNKRYCSDAEENQYISKPNQDALRAIDWVRGAPYCYTNEDYEMLIGSGCCWARKFDENIDNEIIRRLVRNAMGSGIKD